jgi:hypothetical protein
MGLTVNIYRAEFYDGRTGLNAFRNVEALTLVNVEGPFEPSAEAPAALLLKGHDPSGETVRIVPAERKDAEPGESGYWREAPGRPMAGGTYAATSDSRFSDAVKRLTGNVFYGAVSVHDRYET